ncbi:MAG: hypothetical protein DRP34_00525 [Thermodesulfobacteriota bacterium]|nr:MAG: hypothetical protein DRP34_00525 [Thermodesulfobacteriota bacterium]
MQEKIQVHLVINKHLNSILENLSNTLGRTKSDLIKEAIILLADRYNFFSKNETPEAKIMKAIRNLTKSQNRSLDYEHN